ncbi:MAG: hypothetical protein DYH05_04515 [Acidobacteria bacterium ACB1]|nr:hypothetical protein [Pyrinomonadaceae bacterium]MCE7961745.1 hypothetical protein [Acidobacteria bacterium ACB1]RIJ93922.1 MAG: hypothetical protein DCC44_06165 [Acidobacteriota bacterium]
METESKEKRPVEIATETAASNSAESGVQATLDALREEFAEIKETLASRVAKVVDIDAAAGRREEPKLTKEALAKMSHAEIARLDWTEVRRVLSAG